MEPSSQPTSQSKRSRRQGRLGLILILGCLAIAGGLALRNSGWARERRLRTLSVEELALAIHDAPNDPLTFAYYGAALSRADALEESERAFRRSIELDPRSSRAFTGLGTVLLKRGRFSDGRQTLEKAVELNPEDAEAYLGIAQAYNLAGVPAGSVASLRKITELRPKSAIAWFNLGKAYGFANDWHNADRALSRSVALDPKLAAAWRDLGQVDRHYSRLKEAEEHLTQAIRLDRNDPVSHFQLGCLFADLGTTDELYWKAQSCMLNAIQRDPQYVSAHYQLGKLYERRGNWRAAVSSFRKAHELDRSHGEALYYLGLCLIKDGQVEEGRKLVRGAQELKQAKSEIESLTSRIAADPNNRDLLLRRARLYRKYRNSEGAVEDFRAYHRLAKGPEDPAIEKEVADFINELRSEKKTGPGTHAPGSGH